MTQLHTAITEGNLVTVNELLNSGADPNISAEWGESTLYIAISYGTPEIVQILLNNGIRLDAQDNLESLQKAILENQPEMVTHLMNAHVNKDILINGETALHLAIRLGKTEIARLLIEAGANKEIPDEADGFRALHGAVYYNRPEIVRLLLRAGVNKESTTGRYGSTALHCAVVLNRGEIVGLLLDSKVDINARNQIGDIPIHLAHMFRLASIYHMLCQKGAKWDVDVGRFIDDAKLVAAAWGIEGDFTFRGLSVPRGGAVLRHPTLSLFGDILTEREPEIAEVFKADGNLDLTMRLDKIQKGELVVIQCGYRSHVITLVFYKGYLAVCNRDPAWAPTKIYKINPSEMTDGLLQEIATTHLSMDAEVAERFFYSRLSGALGAQSDWICQAFNRQQPQKPQKQNCCAYASPEAALFTILALRELLNIKIPTEVAAEAAMQYAKTQYKEDTTLFRFTILSRYLDQIASNCIGKEYIDRNLLEQIQGRLKDPKWHLERFPIDKPTRALLIERIDRILHDSES